MWLKEGVREWMVSWWVWSGEQQGEEGETGCVGRGFGVFRRNQKNLQIRVGFLRFV